VRNTSTSSAAGQSGPPCAKCGAPTVLGPGTKPHHASIRCTQCRAHRWLPKPEPLRLPPSLTTIRNKYPMTCRDCGLCFPENSGFLLNKRKTEQWSFRCDRYIALGLPARSRASFNIVRITGMPEKDF